MSREEFTIKELHSLLIHRIYHEDNLLQQRNYNFLTANVFLAAGFIVVAGDPTKGISMFAYVIATFGFLWSLLQVAYGKKQVTATNLWRQQAWMAEKELNTKFDLTLFEFYDHGQTKTPFGIIKMTSKKKKPLNKSFLYTLPFLPGTNVLFGVTIPWMIVAFWSMLIFIMLYLHRAPLWVVKFPVVVAIGSLLLTSLLGRPPYPEGILDEHTQPSATKE